MRVEEEGRDAQGQHREPEVDEVGRPDGHGGIEEHQDVTHAHVDTGAGEPRVEDGEGHARRRETTSGSDVPSASERQVAENRLRVNLSGEDFEDRRERQEVLSKTNECTARTTLQQFCIPR